MVIRSIKPSPILLICCLCLFERCDYGDFSALFDFSFTPPSGQESLYQFRKCYFPLYPGDTALMAGSSICTTFINGVVIRIDSMPSIYRTITHPPRFITVNGTETQVIPQTHQEAPSELLLTARSIERFFQVLDSGTFQIAFSDSSGLHPVEKTARTVIPSVVEPGTFKNSSSPRNSWSATILTPHPVNLGQGDVTMTGFSVATRAFALENMIPFIVNGHAYFDCIEVKTYVAINGSAETSTGRSPLVGSYLIARIYSKNIGLIDEKRILQVQKNHPDGSLEIIHKQIIHQRDPRGVKPYPEFPVDTVKKTGNNR
ncbi:MAG: hypothetical protein JW795_17990 [Chitinivibrionales bacterium]|nr:hypothetical protein [Chitinivibrionales bacterium]